MRCGPHHLPLRDLIHRVDVIQPLDALLISLVHRVDAQVTRPSVRIGLAALADGDRRGPCGLVAGVAFAILGGLAKAVDLRRTDGRQSLVGFDVILVVLALQDAPRGGPA